MKQFLILLLSCCISTISLGQNEIGTYFFKDLHQSSALNPSFDANSKWVVSLPSFYGNYIQKGLTVGKVLSGDVLDIFSQTRNQLLGGSELSLIRISYKNNNFRYNFAHNYRGFGDAHFSEPLAQLIYNGNSAFVGGKVSANPYFNYSLYSETVLGFSYINDFSAGFNFKVLNGIQNVSIQESEFVLSVNDDIYQMEASGNLLINSTVPIDITNSDSTGQFALDLFPNNFGFAIDLGLNYKTGPFTFALSILDLGLVTWKDNVRNYASSGTFAFEGLDIRDVLQGNSDLLDTLVNTTNFEIGNNPYRKFVPARVYANVDYMINQKYGAGGLLYYHRSGTLNTFIFAVNGYRKFNDRHQLGLQYSVTPNSFFNAGLNAYTTLGPVQLYGVFDNVLGFINPIGSRFVNARLGVNIIFGNKSGEVIRP